MRARTDKEISSTSCALAQQISPSLSFALSLIQQKDVEYVPVRWTDTQRDRQIQIERETGRQRDRQIQIDRQIQRDKKTERQEDRETGR